MTESRFPFELFSAERRIGWVSETGATGVRIHLTVGPKQGAARSMADVGRYILIESGAVGIVGQLNRIETAAPSDGRSAPASTGPR